MISVYIDDREQSRVKPAYNFFNKLEYPTYILELPIGDYVFVDDTSNIKVAFEYKTIEDYINSLSDYRVFNQAIKQSDNFDYHFVIIVGTESERNNVIKEKKKYNGRYMTLKEFYGSFASILNFSSILQVPNLNHALQLMESVARHCCTDKPVIKRYPKSRGSPALRLLNNTVSGLGLVMAKRICDSIGLYSIRSVFDLTVDDLVMVDGIGVKSAESILKQLDDEFK